MPDCIAMQSGGFQTWIRNDYAAFLVLVVSFFFLGGLDFFSFLGFAVSSAKDTPTQPSASDMPSIRVISFFIVEILLRLSQTFLGRRWNYHSRLLVKVTLTDN